jgi:hypothetical protein
VTDVQHYKIAYVLPYFGKLPGKGFELWLMSCGANPTVDFLLFADDKTDYDYPQNVKVHYCGLADIKTSASKLCDFPISLDTPKKLCDFKPAYGEIFADYLKAYDYWGYCDCDLVWGDIRKFLTDELLSKYERIGFQGHSTLFRNTSNVNARYRTEQNRTRSFRCVLSSPQNYCFDEGGMDEIYDGLGVPYYRETNFAHLSKFGYGFFLGHLPPDDDYKNKHQIIVWDGGNLYRYYEHDGQMFREEFMYVHFFVRPIKFKLDALDSRSRYIMYPDTVRWLDEPITPQMIRKYGKHSAIHYFATSIWANRKKLTVKKILRDVRGFMKSHRR